jgi:peptide/nickel transport system permease protein
VKRFLAYLGRRAAFVIPQVIGVVAITFIVIRMVPGDPARLMGGRLVSEEGLELIRQKMGLSGPLPVQFAVYVKNIFQGDLGYSWYTGNSVISDIARRLPATLELLILALLVTFFMMLPLALKSVSPGGGLAKKISGRGLFGYGMTAGAFPDFWLALIVVFVFYAALHWAPAPTGQLSINVLPPTRITGMYLLDSLFTGNWVAFWSSLSHLILPVFVLSFVYGGGIIKVAIVNSNEIQKSKFINFANVSALPVSKIQAYVTRAVYPSVATMTGIIFGFLIGGAVLVETVFSWGGFGQYAVKAVINSDFAAIQGVVLVSALLNLVVYFLVDIIYLRIDPRIKSIG